MCSNATDNICWGLKCDTGKGKVVRDLCINSGSCTDNDDDICSNYGCLNVKVMYAEGQDCYVTNNEASPNCTDGMVCNVTTNICSRYTYS